MKRTKSLLAAIFGVGIFFFSLASTVGAQIEIGDLSVSGEAGVTGLPRSFSGSKAKFEEYRDIPETVVVPEIKLQIERKQNDFYFDFDATKPGLNDQNYKLRAGRYGLLDMEFEWDQFPHNFNLDTAQTPYTSSNGGGTLTLSNKPTVTLGAGLGNPSGAGGGTPSTATCATNPFCTWLNGLNTGSLLNSDLHPVDLSILNRIARFKLRYTPSPGWTFSGSYWSNHNTGKRAFGSYVGTSPGAYNITELPEPIDYQTHNIELGSEYAGNGWSLGLKYNASLFHNSVSSLTWDNPINLSNVNLATGALTGPCIDRQTYVVSSSTGAITSGQWGPCQSRMDLYPSNQAHTITLTGAASLPLKTHFLSTVSYGWRLQDDSFLPFTSNRCYTSNPAEVGTTDPTRCATALVAMPTINGRNLGGDIRPLMVNATLVNNFFQDLNLKASYRLYSLDNQSKRFTLPQGLVVNDTASVNSTTGAVNNYGDAGAETRFLQYSKNTVGLDASYNLTRWLTAKLGYGWERMHRASFPVRQVHNADEHSFGPTFDIKPTSSLLLRASYRHFWRTAPGYEDDNDLANISRMFDQAARQRDKVGLFAQFTPIDTLNLYAGFDFINDNFNHSVLGLQNDTNYSPSVGVNYSPLDWVRLFADYNWDRFSWQLDSMQRANTTQNPNDPATCDANCLLRRWNSTGKETVHSFSIGTDLDLIKNLLGLRIQYGFSFGKSEVAGSGATCLNGAGLPFPAGTSGGVSSCTPATDYSPITNMWHELLTRLEYQVHKNIALNVGYYFNHYNTKDKGVDIMRTWMGNYDQWSIAGNAELGRSIFLGDQLKGPFSAHVALVGLKLKF